MRAALWLLMAVGPVLAAASADTSAPLPRIVVAFANEPIAASAPAGTTGSRYGGMGYGVGQSARRQAHSVAAAYALREVTSWPIQVLSMHCVVFEISNGRPVADVVAQLSKDSRVVLAQPLQEFHTLTAASAAGAPYNDPLYDLQTNMTALGIARAHERTQGAGVRIALIDTGVDLDHPDLRAASVHSHSFIDRPVSAASLRHGTAMAGLIAAVANNHIGIVGIAPRAQIEVFEACWQLAPGSDAAACNTFTLARALAAALASGASLVNLSFAGPADPLLAALVQAGLKRGVTFVGAAASASAPFPTAIPGVITAAGTEQPLPAGALAAPSQHVLTLRPGGEYDFESGTSVAAAEITAVLALLVAASPTRLPSATLVSLLEGPTAVAASAPPPVDVNAALARLDATRGGKTVAARAPQP
ncbi:MAG TPA: S8 family serine peptidase [Steroidobacteraceae bacterium]|nr:S8 family serine peptidase [Steroidobacteraceae bacterium]